MAEFATIAPMVLDFGVNAIKTQQSNKAAKSQRDYENARIRRSQEIEARRKKEALTRQQAAQRANYGAMGISPSEGSAAAVLRGMGKRVDEDLALQSQEAEIQYGLNNSSYKETKRQNLLALSAPYERMAYGKLKSKLSSPNLLNKTSSIWT